jgi:hypothetical protein
MSKPIVMKKTKDGLFQFQGKPDKEPLSENDFRKLQSIEPDRLWIIILSAKEENSEDDLLNSL